MVLLRMLEAAADLLVALEEANSKFGAQAISRLVLQVESLQEVATVAPEATVVRVFPVTVPVAEEAAEAAEVVDE